MIGWVKHNSTSILSILTSIFIGVILVLLLNQQQANKRLAQNTNNIVHGQNQILQAIKDLAADTKTTAEQKTNIIICMLQVPQDQRTTNTVAGCRKQAEATASPAITQPSQSTSTGQPTTPQSTPSSAPSPSPIRGVANAVLHVLGLR